MEPNRSVLFDRWNNESSAKLDDAINRRAKTGNSNRRPMTGPKARHLEPCTNGAGPPVPPPPEFPGFKQEQLGFDRSLVITG